MAANMINRTKYPVSTEVVYDPDIRKVVVAKSASRVLLDLLATARPEDAPDLAADDVTVTPEGGLRASFNAVRVITGSLRHVADIRSLDPAVVSRHARLNKQLQAATHALTDAALHACLQEGRELPVEPEAMTKLYQDYSTAADDTFSNEV